VTYGIGQRAKLFYDFLLWIPRSYPAADPLVDLGWWNSSQGSNKKLGHFSVVVVGCIPAQVPSGRNAPERTTCGRRQTCDVVSIRSPCGRLHVIFSLFPLGFSHGHEVDVVYPAIGSYTIPSAAPNYVRIIDQIEDWRERRAPGDTRRCWDHIQRSSIRILMLWELIAF